MSTRYSKTTGTFYPHNIEYADIPEDLVEVSDEEYAVVLARGPREVFEIINGKAVITEAPQDPYERQRDQYLNMVRNTREKILQRITGLWVATDDKDLKKSCKAARASLLDITSAPDVMAAGDVETLKAAVTAQYQAVLSDAPEELRKTFNEISI